MLIEIDEEVTDQIVPAAMLISLECAIGCLEDMKECDHLMNHQLEDLLYDIKIITACRLVYKHYTVESDWPIMEELQISLDLDLTEPEAV
jgi:hypothetical protein